MESSGTFEERVGRALDALFDGALLLTGQPERAESLVLGAVADAASRPDAPRDESAFRRWIGTRLVRQHESFRASGLPERRGRRSEDDRPASSHAFRFEEPDLQHLLGHLDALSRSDPDRLGRLIREALLRLPRRARAALWLVDVLGVAWADAAGALDVPQRELRGLLYGGRRELQVRLAVALKREAASGEKPADGTAEGGQLG